MSYIKTFESYKVNERINGFKEGLPDIDKQFTKESFE